jgi:hypothetical protein
MRQSDLDAFESWIDRVIAAKGIPVLVTGPSLFQPPKAALAKKAMDSNLSNYDDYGDIMAGLLKTGADAGQRRILPTWVAFTDQSNPNWIEQDSSV